MGIRQMIASSKEYKAYLTAVQSKTKKENPLTEIRILKSIIDCIESAESELNTLQMALQNMRYVLKRHGVWNEGCFYYNGRSASEFEHTMDLMDKAFGNAEAEDKLK